MTGLSLWVVGITASPVRISLLLCPVDGHDAYALYESTMLVDGILCEPVQRVVLRTSPKRSDLALWAVRPPLRRRADHLRAEPRVDAHRERLTLHRRSFGNPRVCTDQRGVQHQSVRTACGFTWW